MTLALEAPAGHRPLPRTATPSAPAPANAHVTVYGDLTCPWSYLASRRAALLETDGVAVDWRMVEHDCPVPGRQPHRARLEVARRDLERVSSRLLPGEELPHALAGFVPYTRPAVSGYAEAYLADVGATARRLLFDAFWMHAVDLGDARVVRTLLVDTVRSGHSSSEVLRDWGYAVDGTGAPVTTDAWHLLRRWRAGWSSTGEVVPVLLLDDGSRLDGPDAVEWLGAEVVRRNLDVDRVHDARTDGMPKRDHADLYWCSEHGNRWMQGRRDALAPELFSRLRPWI